MTDLAVNQLAGHALTYQAGAIETLFSRVIIERSLS